MIFSVNHVTGLSFIFLIILDQCRNVDHAQNHKEYPLTFPYVQVILSVATCPGLQTVVNMFLVNLAVADILVLIICAPVSILQVNICEECDSD